MNKKLILILLLLLTTLGSAAVIYEHFRIQNTVNVEDTIQLEMTGPTWGNIKPGETVTDYFEVANAQTEVYTARIVTQVAHQDKSLTDLEGLTITYTSDFEPLTEQEGHTGYQVSFRPKSAENPLGLTTITRTVTTATNLQPGAYRVTTHCLPI